ncbi:sce7726 family protein [Mycolicibacterium llatzerense]|uniref:sce7726 family protein n=1 Tax=Mycolicibacterium llatzerense TaxID=280871 RepID=UPI0031D8CF2B
MAARVDEDTPLGAAFDSAYGVLAANYRCEYVFKAAVIGQSLRMEPAANAIVGLPVFMSIADVVVVGQKATAFEIKTDLDSFSRLELQLLSYARCFEHVCVVVSTERASRALDEVPDHVGVLTVDDRAVVPVRPPGGGYSRLDMTTLFRVLRQGERLAVLHRQLGYAVDVPNALLYRRTAELFGGLPLEAAYHEFVVELRGRDARQRAAMQAAGLPASLAAATAGLVLSGVAWHRLGDLLARPAGLFLSAAGEAA